MHLFSYSKVHGLRVEKNDMNHTYIPLIIMVGLKYIGNKRKRNPEIKKTKIGNAAMQKVRRNGIITRIRQSRFGQKNVHLKSGLSDGR